MADTHRLAVQEEETDKLERTLSLVDLLAIGIGGTVGSGVFVLAGEIANSSVSPAGPSATLSFMAAVGPVLDARLEHPFNT